MDVATLELGSFGFGGRVVEIPRGIDGFTRFVETTNPDGSPLLLKVHAGFDAETRVLKWEFHSLDPETGLPPTDPFAGFLPPNPTAENASLPLKPVRRNPRGADRCRHLFLFRRHAGSIRWPPRARGMTDARHGNSRNPT